jgi:DNA repair protein RecO (recombination protein O)
MEENRYTPAIILNRGDWREADSRVIVYTEKFGKRSLLARGTKKPASKLAGHIEPCSLADILVLNGKNREYLGAAIIRQAYFNIKNDLNALYFAGQALAWINSIVKEAASDPALFYLLKTSLEQLNQSSRQALDKASGAVWLLSFKVRALAILGYQPELFHCLSCQETITPGYNYFQVKQGGLLCEKCYILQKNQFLPGEVLTISDDCIKILRFLSSASELKKIKINPILLAETEQLINNLFLYNF